MGNLTRAISADGAVICCAVDSTDLVYEAEQIHQTSAVVTAALGRLLTAASIMGNMLKGEDESVTLRLSGDGPTGNVVAVSDFNGHVKGYVDHPIVELPLNAYGKLDVSGAVGKQGVLYVLKDLGMKKPYIGQVPIVSGEIAEDITSYYAISEQTPTVCGLGVLVNPDLTVAHAGGYLIQLMPGVDEETIEKLEKNVEKIPSVTQMLKEGMTPKDIIFKALEGFDPKILGSQTVEYSCDCNRERVERALISLGKEELDQIIEEDGKAEVQCHFCNKKMVFDKEELKKLRNHSN